MLVRVGVWVAGEWENRGWRTVDRGLGSWWVLLEDEEGEGGEKRSETGGERGSEVRIDDKNFQWWPVGEYLTSTPCQIKTTTTNNTGSILVSLTRCPPLEHTSYPSFSPFCIFLKSLHRRLRRNLLLTSACKSNSKNEGDCFLCISSNWEDKRSRGR